MKNIFLIPTDKPSRLLFDKEEDRLLPLHYEPVFMEHQDLVENQHIYITSAEKIKEGDWACHTSITNDKYQIIRCNISNNVSIQEHWNKIVLTTNQSLDGVQAIDDDFLEWFVKNPSCEEVETKIEFIQTPDNLKDGFYYKIIIPIEGTPQETNEEASKRIYPDKTTPGWIDHWSATERRCFIEGAQWSQQEILYFLYEELTERRPYSSSKMCEVVIEYIQKMNKK